MFGLTWDLVCLSEQQIRDWNAIYLQHDAEIKFSLHRFSGLEAASQIVILTCACKRESICHLQVGSKFGSVVHQPEIV